VLDREALERGEHLAAMLRHGTVIFHELPFTFHVIHAVLTAQSLGRQCVTWLGDLVRWNDWALDECAWDQTGQSLSPLTRDNVQSDFGLVARYCGVAVSTIPGVTESLQDITPNTHWHNHYRPTTALRKVNDGDRIVLVLLPDEKKIRLESLEQRAQELLECVQDDSRLHLIVNQQLASSRPLRDIVGRWTVLDSYLSLPDLANLIATCDLLIEFVDEGNPQSFSMWRSAVGSGVRAIALPMSIRNNVATRLSDRTAPLRAAADLRKAVRSIFGDSPVPVRSPDAGGLELRRLSQPVLRSGKKRILLVNAWAPPQVIGGASRVLQDNLDYFLDHHSDEFELAVFAGDDHREGSGNYTVDAYKGVPIFRFALPPGQNPFWQAESVVAGASFATLLESFQPDLVHIHCLQRLTGSIAQSCRTRGIPYIVTLHDAWWLSDFPFLANADGLPAPAYADYFKQQRNPSYGTTASTLRAERLRQILLGARRRFAVSRSFADLYGSVGIACDVVENGSSKIAVKPRLVSSGPVQVCHLGGRERHKGAYLVEAALRNNGFDNLEFTMVDLTLDRSVISRSTWGSTKVNVIGRLDTKELSELYARMHVLVAPSTCEESFGLVVHEALAHGLWVIASDRGALSEPIQEGVNGHVVDVSDAEAISRALATINLSPERYKEPPASNPRHRSVDDQSRDLVANYRELLSSGEPS
jgi:glycosyltransferase involved in cell wall biosynthesis